MNVEFQNNQVGKPKVTFEGSSEDYKESDAVLFFDGQTFRLERLHRAVKQLRHLRKPGESSAAAAAAIEPRLSPPPAKAPKIAHVGRTAFPTLPVSVSSFPLCLLDLDAFVLIAVEIVHTSISISPVNDLSYKKKMKKKIRAF